MQRKEPQAERDGRCQEKVGPGELGGLLIQRACGRAELSYLGAAASKLSIFNTEESNRK